MVVKIEENTTNELFGKKNSVKDQNDIVSKINKDLQNLIQSIAQLSDDDVKNNLALTNDMASDLGQISAVSKQLRDNIWAKINKR